MDISIRQATEVDLPEITEIYNRHVRESTATFDMDEKSIENRKAWFTAHGPKYPIFVAVADNVVAGWASISPYGERRGWRFTVENTVYLRDGYQGHGLGKMMLGRLVQAADDLGYHASISQVVANNIASIKMHNGFGFIQAGNLTQVGRKFGQWLDIVLLLRVSPAEHSSDD